MALIVNDVGTINLDEKAIRDSKLVRKDEKMVELSNGCICCTRREDLLVEIRELAALTDRKTGKRRFDVLVVESTGVSDPQSVADAFEDDEEMGSLARLDTLVTVVDAAAFGDNFASVAHYGDVHKAPAGGHDHDHGAHKDDAEKQECEDNARGERDRPARVAGRMRGPRFAQQGRPRHGGAARRGARDRLAPEPARAGAGHDALRRPARQAAADGALRLRRHLPERLVAAAAARQRRRGAGRGGRGAGAGGQEEAEEDLARGHRLQELRVPAPGPVPPGAPARVSGRQLRVLRARVRGGPAAGRRRGNGGRGGGRRRGRGRGGGGAKRAAAAAAAAVGRPTTWLLWPARPPTRK